MKPQHQNGLTKKGPLTPGCRHNPYQEAEKLIDYLQRNPMFKGAAICMTHGNGTITTLTVGDLQGAKASFCDSIRRHENHKLGSNIE